MADRSAAALAELLIAGNLQQPTDSLDEVLSGDPPLALWTVCMAARYDRLQPRCLDEAAGWLAGCALKVLQWKDTPVEQGPRPEVFGDRVAAALQVAELAAGLAADRPDVDPPAAFLMGLLHQPAQWLLTSGQQPDGGATPLPRWLTDPQHTAATEVVKLAAGVAAGETPLPDSAGIDPQACRRRAEEGRRRWLAPAGGAASRLPLLAAKLRRLADLENRFQEVVEAEKLEAMAEFAAGAGHEINNPLTVIAGRAQLFLREETDPERRRALALINAQAMRVYEMIADMRLFARPPRPEPKLIDVVELVDGLVESVSPAAAQQEITVCRTGAEGPVQIEVDATQLIVALRAMCQNALDAIGRKGHVEIGVEPGDREVLIRVSDDGPGIPPEQRRHLFDPYYSARQAGRGLGLGLSKSWRIVTNHGGRIDVGSQPGRGTRFTIRLPRTTIAT